MDYKTADRLIELRKNNGYSQEELAEQLNISRQAISKWERAESLPDTENLIALSRLYGVTLDELINGSNDETKKIMETTSNVTTFSNKPVNWKNQELLNFVLTTIGLVIAITCLALIGYFISEIIEVATGYYDHMGESYIRSELIGYSIGLGFSVLGLALGTTLFIASLRRYKICKSKN